MKKNLSFFFRDRVTLDFIARAVQSLSGFEIEGKGVLAAPDHLVPNIAFFQRRSLVLASSLDGVENAGAAQNQYLFPIGQLGSEVTFLFEVEKRPTKIVSIKTCSSKQLFRTLPNPSFPNASIGNPGENLDWTPDKNVRG